MQTNQEVSIPNNESAQISNLLKRLTTIGYLLIFTLTAQAVSAQVGGWNPRLMRDASNAIEDMQNDKLAPFFEEAYGYVVFPKITKVGIGFGGAAGNGVVYVNGEVIGSSKLKQATVGIQLGGQQYSELIFFKNRDAFEHFINGNLKFDAQSSAVVLTEGASINAAYHEDVAVFTKTKGGLMYEASIGGQHFTYEEMR